MRFSSFASASSLSRKLLVAVPNATTLNRSCGRSVDTQCRRAPFACSIFPSASIDPDASTQNTTSFGSTSFADRSAAFTPCVGDSSIRNVPSSPRGRCAMTLAAISPGAACKYSTKGDTGV